jgi:prepilin-type processing-associated H-X9-DG protein
VKIGDVKDGTMKTIAISEVLGYREPTDGRGAWMWAGMGGSSFTAYLPPNAKGEGTNHPNYDNVSLCGATSGDEEKYHCLQTFKTNVNGTSLPGESAAYAAARSHHRGGVNVVYCDLHTDFVPDSVDLRIWRALCTRKGPNYWDNSNTNQLWVEPDAQPGDF